MNRNDRNEQVLDKMLGTKAIKSGYKGLECGKPLETDDLIMIECKVTDNGLLDKVKSYLAYDEDDDTVLQLGNVYLDFAFDIETGDFRACNVVDTESSTWELYPEEIGEIFGKDFLNYKKSNFIESSKKVIKSSRESTRRAYDVCKYVNKELRKNPRNVYNGWFINERCLEYDYAWFKVEHTDYSVRLQFTFTNTDFVYVDGYFTNRSYYDKKTITSWNFGRETPEETLDHVKDVLDSFFASGIEMLRSSKQIKSSKRIRFN